MRSTQQSLQEGDTLTKGGVLGPQLRFLITCVDKIVLARLLQPFVLGLESRTLLRALKPQRLHGNCGITELLVLGLESVDEIEEFEQVAPDAIL